MQFLPASEASTGPQVQLTNEPLMGYTSSAGLTLFVRGRVITAMSNRRSGPTSAFHVA